MLRVLAEEVLPIGLVMVCIARVVIYAMAALAQTLVGSDSCIGHLVIEAWRF